MRSKAPAAASVIAGNVGVDAGLVFALVSAVAELSRPPCAFHDVARTQL